MTLLASNDDGGCTRDSDSDNNSGDIGGCQNLWSLFAPII